MAPTVRKRRGRKGGRVGRGQALPSTVDLGGLSRKDVGAWTAVLDATGGRMNHTETRGAGPLVSSPTGWGA